MKTDTDLLLTAKQAQRLGRIARRRNTSNAAWDRALASVGGFRSGRQDISDSHDGYLADASAD